MGKASITIIASSAKRILMMGTIYGTISRTTTTAGSLSATSYFTSTRTFKNTTALGTVVPSARRGGEW